MSCIEAQVADACASLLSHLARARLLNFPGCEMALACEYAGNIFAVVLFTRGTVGARGCFTAGSAFIFAQPFASLCRSSARTALGPRRNF